MGQGRKKRRYSNEGEGRKREKYQQNEGRRNGKDNVVKEVRGGEKGEAGIT